MGILSIIPQITFRYSSLVWGCHIYKTFSVFGPIIYWTLCITNINQFYQEQCTVMLTSV